MDSTITNSNQGTEGTVEEEGCGFVSNVLLLSSRPPRGLFARLTVSICQGGHPGATSGDRTFASLPPVSAYSHHIS